MDGRLLVERARGRPLLRPASGARVERLRSDDTLHIDAERQVPGFYGFEVDGHDLRPVLRQMDPLDINALYFAAGLIGNDDIVNSRLRGFDVRLLDYKELRLVVRRLHVRGTERVDPRDLATEEELPRAEIDE